MYPFEIGKGSIEMKKEIRSFVKFSFWITDTERDKGYGDGDFVFFEMERDVEMFEDGRGGLN